MLLHFILFNKNIYVNEHERLYNLTLFFKVKSRNSDFIAVLPFSHSRMLRVTQIYGNMSVKRPLICVLNDP